MVRRREGVPRVQACLVQAQEDLLIRAVQFAAHQQCGPLLRPDLTKALLQEKIARHGGCGTGIWSPPQRAPAGSDIACVGEFAFHHRRQRRVHVHGEELAGPEHHDISVVGQEEPRGMEKEPVLGCGEPVLADHLLAPDQQQRVAIGKLGDQDTEGSPRSRQPCPLGQPLGEQTLSRLKEVPGHRRAGQRLRGHDRRQHSEQQGQQPLHCSLQFIAAYTSVPGASHPREPRTEPRRNHREGKSAVSLGHQPPMSQNRSIVTLSIFLALCVGHASSAITRSACPIGIGNPGQGTRKYHAQGCNKR